MVSVLGLVVLGVLVAVNTAVAAVLTRLLRVRLDTDWGTAVLVGFFVPIALVFTTIVLGSVLGPDLGSRVTVFVLLVGVPLVLGVSIDVLWMPAPEEVELPDATGD
jgi:cell division protein FtsW (lipid II flippase)